jgi:hypothetical protein
MARLNIARLLILFFWVVPVWAQNHALLIDRSGSMRPYYQTGLIDDLGQEVHQVMRSHGTAQIIAFSTEATPVRDLTALAGQPRGKFTYLDRAIGYVIQHEYSIAWMITDNIQDQPGAPDAGNTQVFYRKLRSDTVKKVIIFPLLQPAGTSGIIIYAFLLAPEADGVFEKEIVEFLSRVRGAYRTEALRMKPLDRDTIDINIVKGNLQPKQGNRGYKEGQNIHESFEIRFKSKFEHLKILDAQIEAPPAKPEFSPTSLLKPEKQEFAIKPERVVALDPQKETDQLYLATVDLGKIKLKRDLASLWKAAWDKSDEQVTLNLRFVIRVPQENLKFKDSFLQFYNAGSLPMAKATGKIYAIETLPLHLVEATTPIVAQVPLTFRVEYPWWPALLWILLFVLGAAILVGAVVALSKVRLGKAKEWTVAAETDRSVALKCERNAQGQVLVQSDPVGTIAKNSFVPASDVTVDGASRNVKLEDGLRLKVDRKGRPVILVFKEATAQQAAAPSSYTPQKR